MRTVLSPLLIALVLACVRSSPPADSAGGEVRLRVAPEAASPGDSVTLVLSNATDGAIGYNLCTSHLERRIDGDWQEIVSDRVCTMELRSLPAGEEVSYSLMLPPELAAGDYRFGTNVHELELDTGERRSVRSDPFRVSG